MNNNQDLNNSLVKRFREFVCRNDEFDITMNRICFSIGIPKRLNPIELDLIFNFIKKEFPSISISFIDEAFSKYSAEKLRFKMNGKDVSFIEHFGKFENTFIGRVLNSYTIYLSEELRSVKTQESYKRLEVKDDIKQCFDFIDGVFKETGKEPFIANWKAAFKYAQQTELISLTFDEKEMYADNVIAELQEEMNYKKVRKLNGWQDLRDTLNNPSLLAFECQKRYLIQFFSRKYSK